MALTDIVICQLADKNSPVKGPVTQQFPIVLFGMDADGAANHRPAEFLDTSTPRYISQYNGGLFCPMFQPKADAVKTFGAVSDNAANPDALYDPVVQ